MASEVTLLTTGGSSRHDRSNKVMDGSENQNKIACIKYMAEVDHYEKEHSDWFIEQPELCHRNC